MLKTKEKEKRAGILCLLLNLVVYVGFSIADGPVWCRDSDSYATMNHTREPIYCTFLWILRRLFGEIPTVHGWDLTDGKSAAMEPRYLLAVIICQAVVLAVTVWYLVKNCYAIGKDVEKYGISEAFGSVETEKQEEKKHKQKINQKKKTTSGKLQMPLAVLFALAANFFMWGVDLANRFGAKRGSAYFQSIMTEGLGIPFYILFILFLFRYLCSRRRNEQVAYRYLFACVTMMVLCTCLHKQLAVTVLLFAFFALGMDLLWIFFTKKKNIRNTLKWLLKDISALLCALLLIFLVEHVYNLAAHGSWMSHTGNADKIDSTLIYTVTKEDADLFDRYGKGEEKESLKNLFLEIIGEMEERGLRYVDADESDWSVLCSHYADSYDIIGYEILDPMVEDYVQERNPELNKASNAFAQETDRVCTQMEKVLLHQDLKRFLYLWINNIRKGFVETVLRENRILNWGALFLWALYLAGMALLWRNRKKTEIFEAAKDRAEENAKARTGRDGKAEVLLFAALVFTGTLFNSIVVGAIIFPQTRYMIYNMGLFYVALSMLFGSLLPERQGQKI